MPEITLYTVGSSAYVAASLPDWLSPEALIPALGSWVVVGLCAILFAECALLVGFFLPGDSLLFFGGIFYASGAIDSPLVILLAAMSIAAFLGNMVGYWIGYKVGPAVFTRPRSKLFKPAYVDKSAALFERWGKPAIVVSRFVPIARTVAPPMAGAAKMDLRIYATYSLIGGVLWIVSVTMTGVWLGQIEFVRENVDLLIVLGALGFLVLAGGPALWHYLRRRRAAATD